MLIIGLRSILFIVLLLFLSGCNASNCNLDELEVMLKRNVVTKTIEGFEEIEAQSLGRLKGNLNVPQVPFGYKHEKWLAFKEQYQDGDCLVHFITSEESWKRLSGMEGYALLRDDTVVDIFILIIN